VSSSSCRPRRDAARRAVVCRGGAKARGRRRRERRLTDTDDGETLVDEDRVVGHLAAGPVGSTVAHALAEGDGAGAEGGDILVLAVVVGGEDTTPARGAVLRQRVLWVLLCAVQGAGERARGSEAVDRRAAPYILLCGGGGRWGDSGAVARLVEGRRGLW